MSRAGTIFRNRTGPENQSKPQTPLVEAVVGVGNVCQRWPSLENSTRSFAFGVVIASMRSKGVTLPRSSWNQSDIRPCAGVSHRVSG